MDNITILGCGRVGSAMALDLARDGEFRVTAADRSREALARLAARGIADPVLRPVPGGGGAGSGPGRGPGGGRGARPPGLRHRAGGAGGGQARGGHLLLPEDPFLLDDLAREQGLVAVVDAGMAPGCDNIILGDLAREWGTITRFECLVGGLPVVRTWPYEYKAGFSPVDVLEEYTRPSRYVADGRMVVRPALSEAELVDFPGPRHPGGVQHRRAAHPAAPPCRRRSSRRRPCAIRATRRRCACCGRAGFRTRSPGTWAESGSRPWTSTAALLFPLWEMKEGDEDFTVMRVTVEGLQDGRPRRKVFHLLDRFDRAAGTTSMARTTGYTCTAVARLVASGRYRRAGVNPPEYLGREPGCWAFVREELARRGVVFTETE